MFWEVREQSDLFARIDQWKQKVEEDTLQQGFIRQPPSHSNKLHHMNLRSRTTRPALAGVSGNSHSRKRKASVVMADTAAVKAGKKVAKDGDIGELIPRPGRGRPTKNPTPDSNQDEAQEQPAPRPRGRPPKSQDRELVNLPELDLQIRPGFSPSIWSTSGPTSPRKAGTSPSKRQLTLDKQISEAAIDMGYLSRCDPAVRLTTFRELRVEGTSIVSAVEELFAKLQLIPHGVIPPALEVIFST